MRRAARVDENQAEIVAALREIPGVTVRSLAAVGDGFPDISVGYRTVNYFFEIKNPSKPKRDRRLKPKQKKFREEWTGQVHIAETIKDIIDVIA